VIGEGYLSSEWAIDGCAEVVEYEVVVERDRERASESDAGSNGSDEVEGIPDALVEEGAGGKVDVGKGFGDAQGGIGGGTVGSEARKGQVEGSVGSEVDAGDGFERSGWCVAEL